MKLFEKKIQYINNKKIKKYKMLGVTLGKRSKRIKKREGAISQIGIQNDFEKRCSALDFSVSEEHKKQVLRQLENISDGKVSSVKICYISCTGQNQRPLNDPSTRYRCYHPAEALQKNVFLSSVTSLAAFLAAPSYDYDVYVFHRPSCSVPRFLMEFSRLEQLGKILIADYDDLIFGGKEIALQSSIFLNKVRDKQSTISIFEQNLQALKLFRFVSVSTNGLRDMVLKFHPQAKVSVIHNFLPESVFTLAQNHKYVSKKKDKNLIMYCSGTLSHNQDFKVVSKQIRKLLNEDKRLRFFIVGTLEVDSELNNHPRVFSHPPVNYWDLFSIMQNAAFTIAPLTDTDFNRSKSRVKFLESALSGALLLASPIPDMEEITTPGLLLMRSSQDWTDTIRNRYDFDFEKAIKEDFEYLHQNCDSRSFYVEFSNMIRTMKE